MHACSFRVINQRAALVFNYFLNATEANGFFSPATLAASAGPLPFENYNAPQHVHLALTQKQGEVLVQWTTRDACTPTVFYGEVSGALLKVHAPYVRACGSTPRVRNDGTGGHALYRSACMHGG